MILVTMELWPSGFKTGKSMLGRIKIWNDRTGSDKAGNYKYKISHAGKFYGKRKEPYKTGRITGFPRHWSPYKLLSWVLKDAGELA